MSGGEYPAVNGPDHFAAEAAAFAEAAQFSEDLALRIGAAGAPVDAAARANILAAMAPGFLRFNELARLAGELAGCGDPLGALSLLGGEQNARDMLGDEEIEHLIAEAASQMVGEMGEETEK